MTLLSTAQHIARDTRKDPRGHMVLIVVATTLTAGAIALVAYLLWPTWGAGAATGPERLPVSVGTTLFNVPTSAIRRKIQRHSGPQERVDLSFVFPSLEAPDAPRHVSADMVEEGTQQPIDRIFLSISAHDDTRVPRRFALRQRGSVLGRRACPRCPLHARRHDAGHVPQRAPRRRRRSDVPLSEKLACAMARRGERDGAFDRADAQPEGVAALPLVSAEIDQVFLENRHLELERAIVVLVIDEQHPDELLADIDLGGVVLFRPWHDADLRIAEYTLEIGVELPDFLNVHGASPIGFF